MGMTKIRQEEKDNTEKWSKQESNKGNNTIKWSRNGIRQGEQEQDWDRTRIKQGDQQQQELNRGIRTLLVNGHDKNQTGGKGQY